MKVYKGLHMVAFLLLIVGGLNWLILGVFGTELGALFGGSSSLLARALYVIIGIAAVYEVLIHKKVCIPCQQERVQSTPDPAVQV